MKKNYTSPVVEVNVFDVADVIMTSGEGNTPSYNMAANGGGSASDFKQAAGNAIVVEW